MTVESATYISSLNASNPAGSDYVYEGDNHIRLIKSVIKATFPNISGAMTATHTELNQLAGDPNFDSGVLYVDKTSNRVGINDTTPSYSLDVTGTVNVTGAVTFGSTLGVTGNTTVGGTFGVTGVTTMAEDLNVDSGVLFVDVDTNRVGINDTTPGYSLDVNGTVNATGAVTLGGTLAVTGVTTLSNDVNVNSGTLFVDVSANRVGVAQLSPSYALDVTGSIRATVDIIALNNCVVADGYGFRFGDGSARISGSGSTDTISFYVDATEYYRMSTAAFRPAGGGLNLGANVAGQRWETIYSVNDLDFTSDARLKTPVRDLTEGELLASRRLSREMGFFQWLSSIKEKGEDKAHWHCGITAQRAEEILLSEQLDPSRYSFLRYNEEADEYSLRPSELLNFIARGLDARLRALEELMGDK
jgi:hypothetical protein